VTRDGGIDGRVYDVSASLTQPKSFGNRCHPGDVVHRYVRWLPSVITTALMLAGCAGPATGRSRAAVGIFFVRVEGVGFTETRRLTVVR